MFLICSCVLFLLQDKHPCVGDVRSIGLFGCIELVKNRRTKEVLGPFVGVDPHVAKMNAFLKDQGVYAFQCEKDVRVICWANKRNPGKNFLHTNPPLCVTEKVQSSNSCVLLFAHLLCLFRS